MPKVVNDSEKELTKQALHKAAIELIKNKGLRNVTVDSITKATGMAKGSFYFYYQTKEELLYEVVKTSEKALFEAVMAFKYYRGNFRRNVEKVLRDIYLAPESLALYLTQENLKAIYRKFPSGAQQQENSRSADYLERTRQLFGLSESAGSTLACLMDGLQFLASYEHEFGKKTRSQSLDIMVSTIAKFINDNSRRKEK